MSIDLMSHAVIATPFGRLGLWVEAERLKAVDFLPSHETLLTAHHPLLRETEQQIAAYFRNPDFVFDLPYQLQGTAHQLKVWEAIAAIPAGAVTSYAAIASQIGSAPRAIGGACGRNPLPVIIPCHRVVAAKGFGGFNANRNDLDWLPIKRWLLRHEGLIYAE
nr:methylated-DNA--[protein]-cysteine S-methyltransferase [uncultured Deefgea sp.]